MKFWCDYSSRFRILKGGKVSLVVSALLSSATLSFASPSGGVVTSGSANIAQSGAVTNINQSTQKASINWQSFGIAKNETVNFNQPSKESVTLNRVVGTTNSMIDGMMNATGSVILVNPNGVVFTKDATVNVGGLIATTKNITDENFNKGNYVFEGDSQNSILNMGTINANYVAMMGKNVQNDGTITAKLGRVELAGGERFTLDINGNSLLKLTIDKGTLDSLVSNKGLIQAEGGVVHLTTNAVDEILKSAVNNTGIIEANSIDTKNGEIVLYAHGGDTTISGTIEAKGGFVETSGKTLDISNDTKIKAKKLLIDPTDVVIDSSDGRISDDNIGYTFLQSALSEGDVTIQADNSITVNADITFNAHTLELIAGGDDAGNSNGYITVNKTITVGTTVNSEGTLKLRYGKNGHLTMGMTTDKTGYEGHINIASGAHFYMWDSFNRDGDGVGYKEYQLIRSYQDLNSMYDGWVNDDDYNLVQYYAIASDFDWSAGGDNLTSFTPVGEQDAQFGYSKDFRGVFEGLGHTISNLKIEAYNYGYNFDQDFEDITGVDRYLQYRGQSVGLFGSIAVNALVENVKLLAPTVSNTEGSGKTKFEGVGALVGQARVGIEFDEEEFTYDFIGAPKIYNNIVVGGSVTATGTIKNIGGIVGQVRNGEEGYDDDDDYDRPDIESNKEYSVELKNNVVMDTTISGDNSNVGGIVGTVESGINVENSYVKGAMIHTEGSNAGAIAGKLYASWGDDFSAGAMIIDSMAEGNTVVARRNAGGLVGVMGDKSGKIARIQNSYYQLDDTVIGETMETATAGVITYGGIYYGQYNTWKTSGMTPLTASTYFGASVDGYYTIDSTQDLKDMLAFGYIDGNNFKLAQDFTLTGAMTGATGWYIPMLKGTLDGNNHTITGLNVDQEYNGYLGLVGRLAGGSIQNLTLSNVTLNGHMNIGGAAGMVRGDTVDELNDYFSDGSTISNVTVTNFNYNVDKTFNEDENSIGFSNIIDVSYNNIGALAGYVSRNTTIQNVNATGSIVLKNTIGDLDGNADEGDYVIDGIYHIGGMIGNVDNDDTTIKSTTNTPMTADVSIEIRYTITEDDSHGRNGHIEGIGGFIGGVSNSYRDTVVISNAKAMGDILVLAASENSTTVETYSIGGFVGFAGSTVMDNITATNAITITGDDVESVGGVFGEGWYNELTNLTYSGAGITIKTLNENYAGYIGGLIGYDEMSNITTASVSGNITIGEENNKFGQVEFVGGMLGQGNGTNLTDTTTTASITATNTNEGYAVGGLIGYSEYWIDYNTKLNFNSNYASAEDIVTAFTAYSNRADVQALVAQGYEVINDSFEGSTRGRFFVAKDDVEFGLIKNSHTTGNINVQNADTVGGIIGVSYNTQLINSYSTGNITANDSENIGGIFGYHSDYGDTLIKDSYYTGTITANGSQYIGGMIGYLYSGVVLENSYATVTINSNKGDGIGRFVGYLYEVDLDGADIPTNLDVTLNLTDTTTVGSIIGYAEYSTITNLSYTGSLTIAHDEANGNDVASAVGGLIGSAYDTSIRDSYADITITLPKGDNIGGLVGKLEGESEIINSYAKGSITTTDSQSVGGLVGYNPGSYIGIDENADDIGSTMSYADVNIIVTNGTNIGGLVGEMGSNAVIYGAYAKGNITATVTDGEESNAIGGLIGRAYGGTIYYGYAKGKVTASDTNKVGGLVGEAQGDTHIEVSFASGAVVGYDQVGGLVGSMVNAPDTIQDSYAVGNVTGNDYVGGLVGQLIGSNVTNTYSAGTVTGVGENVGGLVGAMDGGSNVEYSYYNYGPEKNNSDRLNNGIGLAKTTEQMNAMAAYTTEIEGNEWNIEEDTTLAKMFPQLRPIAQEGSVWMLNPSATKDPSIDIITLNYSLNDEVKSYGTHLTLPTPTFSGGEPTEDDVEVKVYNSENEDVTEQAKNGTLGVGTYTIKTLLINTEDFEFAQEGNIDAIFTITKASIISSIPDITAHYRQAVELPTASFTGGTPEVSYTRVYNSLNEDVTAMATAGNLSVGTYTVRAVLDDPNFEISEESTLSTFTITKKELNYSIQDAIKTYGEAYSLATPLFTGGTPTGTKTVKVFNGDTDVTEQALAGTLTTGTYSIKTILSDDSYEIAESGNTDGILVVNKANVNYALSNDTKRVGQAYSLATPTIKGGTPSGTKTVKVYNGDTDVTEQALAGTLPIGKYTIKAFLDDTNYELASNGNTNGILTIEPQTKVSDIVTNIVNSAVVKVPTIQVTAPVQRADAPVNVFEKKVASSIVPMNNNPIATTVNNTQPQTIAINQLIRNVINTDTVDTGARLTLVSDTGGEKEVASVTMDTLMARSGGGELRVALSPDSFVELVNGGVSLPNGVSQELYVVKE